MFAPKEAELIPEFVET